MESKQKFSGELEFFTFIYIKNEQTKNSFSHKKLHSSQVLIAELSKFRHVF